MYQPSNGMPAPVTAATSPSVARPNPQWRIIQGARRVPRRVIPTAWWVGVLALLLAVLVLYVHTVNQEFRLTRMKDDLRQMNQDITQLRWEKARIENPRNIDDLARKDLAMQAPKDVVFMTPPKVAQATKVNRIPLPPAVVHEGF